ncbi:MAG: hypothetical protein ACOC6C_01850 [Verrucomicrobiota bacterium]
MPTCATSRIIADQSTNGNLFLLSLFPTPGMQAKKPGNRRASILKIAFSMASHVETWYSLHSYTTIPRKKREGEWLFE